jgi:hypothetical protein
LADRECRDGEFVIVTGSPGNAALVAPLLATHSVGRAYVVANGHMGIWRARRRFFQAIDQRRFLGHLVIESTSLHSKLRPRSYFTA